MSGSPTFNSQTEAQANAIAKTAEAKVGIGFDVILSVVTALLPILAKCFSSTPTSSPDAQAYLEDHYDETTQTFDAHLINQVRPQARRAARQSGQGRMNRVQLDTISTEALERARTADSAEVSEVIKESLAA